MSALVNRDELQRMQERKRSAETRYPAALADAAYHGLAGDVVRTIQPHTEADDVAILVQFLVSFGSCVGRGPHYAVEGDEHHANLFAVLVGDTAKARKGTSWGRVRQLFALLADTWSQDCVRSGLSSGEGLIWSVRDATDKDPGVFDKRALIVESEYANTLRVADREGNTLSPIVRDAWDKGTLATITKNSPARATGAHISIIGHVTSDELRRYLNRTEMANGFANRFIFFCVRRSKYLPHGGSLDPRELEVLAERLASAIKTARSLGRVRMSDATRVLWEAVYPKLSEGSSSLTGSITARSEAQVVRIATAYAMLDGVPLIEPEHLKAALSLWEYAEVSAEYIFGRSTGDNIADRILAALLERAEMTRTEINGLFSGNVSRDRIDVALGRLAENGSIEKEERETRGRPMEVWKAT
jgi:hypothetical protein